MNSIENLRQDVNAKHEANLARFSQIEVAVAYVKGQMKIIIGLLAANGAIDLYGVLSKK